MFNGDGKSGGDSGPNSSPPISPANSSQIKGRFFIKLDDSNKDDDEFQLVNKNTSLPKTNESVEAEVDSVTL